MKRIIFTFAVTIASLCSFAQEKNSFAQANELYINGDYKNAALLYEEILREEGISAEVYYNLGNTYYKLNETALSILNYERALRLKPFYSDAKYNLELAQQRMTDKASEERLFFIKSWITTLINILPTNVWSWISISLFIVCLIFLFLFAFGKKISIRKLGFRVALCLFGISFCTFLFANITYKKNIKHAEAIVMSGIVTIKSSPDQSGNDLFVLHEGSKVVVRETLGEWYQISFGDGNIGWVKTTHLERI